ncbi:hypothetical protein MCOR27_003780 [Pyricularia oryzae]|uniref:Uncharacterized protein n=2 Tax=Pyricularia TaxID=48558 RepID=A0ABQ8NE45_PYRGI|nr:hypothetical protein MCOR01_007561 [Pyricularia oryzae]KAI6295555.1 hypothetical protein MCOR33_007573 [Pyricularia grisea]KAI6254287.1 hypothetical protein MCOR19_009201 [Pyricularia oryzae]KAI6282378.1 hypothetical protein MCOR27_003780 [Pyricularia oryzae]KAI6284857.1 hypothetical protein MCOR26_001753 [Pyricularia oryzae]
MDQAGLRCFDAVYVNPVVGVQSPANRFGSGSDQHASHAPPPSVTTTLTEESWQGSDSDEDEFEDEIFAGQAGYAFDSGAASSPTRGSTRFARLRTNLTALSQVYNLYFVAYLGVIHVYSPENAPQVLRRAPLLCLKPTPCPVAAITRGHISVPMPHQVNNMITGMLGDSEVLLAAFDDGDVVGYYTHQIAEAIEHAARRSSGKNVVAAQPPYEFFHRGVGKSAWGLAVHAKSRLIAVSSNTHEVTVFALSLLKGSGTEQQMPPKHERCNPPKLGGLGLDAHQLESHLRQRTRDWRIILHTRPENQANIPSISFLDDENGEGDKIVAVDTAGHCWIFDIWALGAPNICLYPIGAGRPTRHPIGWGVMTLPDELFQEVETATQFTGLNREDIDGFSDVGGRHVLELTAGVAKIPRNAGRDLPTGIQTLRRTQIREDVPFRMPDVFPDACEKVHSPLARDVIKETIRMRDSRWYKLGRVFCEDNQERDKLKPINIESDPFQAAMTIVPSSALVYQHENLRPCRFLNSVLCSISRKQHAETVYYGKDGQNTPATRCRGLLSASVVRRFSILRTTDTDVELHNLDTEKTDVLCRKLLPSIPLKTIPHLSDMQYSQRICMLHCIPELSLVVVGSCCGRVGLIRLTKARGGGEFRHGFRTEWILPRTDEDTHAESMVWMVGMAVSRVPQPGARGLHLFPPSPSATAATSPEKSLFGRGYSKSRPYDTVARWRLLLHFMDHTILSYTIEASKPQDDQMDIEVKVEEDSTASE